jgi:hypothetical protein
MNITTDEKYATASDDQNMYVPSRGNPACLCRIPSCRNCLTNLLQVHRLQEHHQGDRTRQAHLCR